MITVSFPTSFCPPFPTKHLIIFNAKNFSTIIPQQNISKTTSTSIKFLRFLKTLFLKGWKEMINIP